jgi:hypothetical protein
MEEYRFFWYHIEKLANFPKGDRVKVNFEKNRKELLEKIDIIRHTAHKNQPVQEAASTADIVLFGEKTPFLDSLVEILDPKCVVKSFSNAEEAITYCLDNSLQKIILDMDPPTDWKMATDVFTTIRTINIGVQFILCTKSPQSTPVEILRAQRAEVLCKPFGVDALFQTLKLE